MSRRFQACAATLSGAPIAEGTVLTGTDIQAWVISNGLVRVSKPDLVPNPIEGGLTMERWNGSEWLDCFGAQYGDWCFFASPLQNRPSSVEFLTVSDEEIEVAIHWAPHPLNTGYLGLGGVLDRDWNGAANYDNGGTFKVISSLTSFTKTIKLVRGREGYFVGYHSVPSISPKNGLAGNNETGYGEREAGLGGGNALAWFSTGIVTRHPEYGSKAAWAGLYTTQRHGWGGIDDPNASSPYIDAPYIAIVNAIRETWNGATPPVFPSEQTVGPWWVADVHASNWTQIKVCRYIAMVGRLEIASWQFAAPDYGQTVVHLVNELSDETGALHRYQLFIGAFPYTSPYDMTTSGGRANEPCANLQTRLAARIADDFDDHGVPDDDSEATFATNADAIAELAAQIAASSPETLSTFSFRSFREATASSGGLEAWAQQAGSSAFRYFATRIVSSSEDEQDGGTLVTAACECVVAYPVTGDYGGSDAETLAVEDITTIEAALGTGDDIGCTVTDSNTEVQGRVLFATVSFTAEFWTA